MKIHLLCAALLLAAAVPAAAKDDAVLPALDKETAEAFQPQVDRVHAEMQPGGRFEYIEGRDRDRVNADLDTMSEMIRANGTVAAMKEEDKIRLFNIQEKVNSILTRSDSNHMVCEKVQQPGTMLRLTHCRTFAEIRRAQRDSQNELEKTQNSLMIRSFTAGAAGH